MKRILVCCDSFKGTLSSFEVNKIVSTELSKLGFQCTALPMADGGEGSLDIINSHLEVKCNEVDTYSADHSLIRSHYYAFSDKAFIDVAGANGLTRIDPLHRKPLQLSSYGTGVLFKHALDQGVKDFDLFLGGSATVDGGMGLICGLLGEPIPNENPLIHLDRKLVQSAKIAMEGMAINVITDVNNLILGSQGAATIFGPQKGASPEEVLVLEDAMQHWVEILESISNNNLQTIPGLGAAGGLALPFAAFANSKVINGYNYFSSLLNYNQAIDECDVVITGEGCIDHQTMMGKGPGRLAQEASDRGKVVIGIGGMVQYHPEAFHKVFTTSKSIPNEVVTQKKAISRLQSTVPDVAGFLNNI